MRHVFIVGAKSLGAYGGYETFVNKLTEYHQNHHKITYHIACKANGDGCMDEAKLCDVKRLSDTEFLYHNAHCFKIKVPNIGAAQAIYYDLAAIKYCCDYVVKHKIPNPIIYILACRIGPFAGYFQKRIHSLGGKLYVNPDGHEFLRAKWSNLIKKYWKLSERLMIKHCDLAICDSVNIEKYIQEGYRKYQPQTTYIAYGAETRKSKLTDDDAKVRNWYKEKQLRVKEYYLVVGRFVPENNYETMIREFMQSHSQKDFVIITNVNTRFLNELEEKLHFKADGRIKFVGTVYDQELLMKIRENAYGYFHGHEVGGTNPSLLEALSTTDLNLLLDVSFNREVGKDTAIYWTKVPGDLTKLIERADAMSEEDVRFMGIKAKTRVKEAYNWKFIANRYEQVFE